jgi:hypothetical protein
MAAEYDFVIAPANFTHDGIQAEWDSGCAQPLSEELNQYGIAARNAKSSVAFDLLIRSHSPNQRVNTDGSRIGGMKSGDIGSGSFFSFFAALWTAALNEFEK